MLSFGLGTFAWSLILFLGKSSLFPPNRNSRDRNLKGNETYVKDGLSACFCLATKLIGRPLIRLCPGLGGRSKKVHSAPFTQLL
jgi:hypothetical protein